MLWQLSLTLGVIIILSTLAIKNEVDELSYPWTGSYKERNEFLLNIVRQENLLEAYEDIIPKSLLESDSPYLIYRDINGTEYRASLFSKSKTEENALDLIQTNIEAFDVKLAKICAIFTTPYWSYEWCHKNAVHQFHVTGEIYHSENEVPAENQQQNNIHFIKREPNWSLGTYYRTKILRENKSNNAENNRIVKVMQYFRNGQHCDETGEGRKTKVTLMCCLTPETIPFETLALLTEIREPETCVYDITVCTPLLCQKSSSQNWALTDIMTELLESPCLSRQEDWWQYEICFNDSIRQFHLVITAAADNSGKRIDRPIIEAQFDLGFAPDASFFANETALEMSLSDNENKGGSHNNNNNLLSKPPVLAPARTLGSVKEWGAPSLLLEYTGGTPCDLLKEESRATTVELTCGVRDMITDVFEDRTCHYHFRVTSHFLCKSKLFAPKKKEVNYILISPVDGQDDSNKIVQADSSHQLTPKTRPTQGQPTLNYKDIKTDSPRTTAAATSSKTATATATSEAKPSPKRNPPTPLNIHLE